MCRWESSGEGSGRREGGLYTLASPVMSPHWLPDVTRRGHAHMARGTGAGWRVSARQARVLYRWLEMARECVIFARRCSGGAGLSELLVEGLEDRVQGRCEGIVIVLVLNKQGIYIEEPRVLCSRSWY